MNIATNFQEIERKFLIRSLPVDLEHATFTSYERFYLYADESVEMRIQKKDGQYELERKVASSHLWIRDSYKIEITEMEFLNLQKSVIGNQILYKKYRAMSSPNVSIKKYAGNVEGFMLAEIGFLTLEEAEQFQPFDWLDREISHESFSKDSGLMYLTASPLAKM